MITIIALSLFALVTSDDTSKNIEEEESKRHSEYLKAVQTGTKFPILTDQEIADAEKAMAAVYRLGDPDRPFPENEADLDSDLCGVFVERAKKVMSYVSKKYPAHLMVQVAVRLNLHSLSKKNEEYCKSKESRKSFIKMAIIINTSVQKLKVPRSVIIGSFRSVIYEQSSKSKMGTICCSYWIFKKDSVKALPHKQVKKFLKDMLTSYNSKSLEYLCVHYAEDSQKCAALEIPLPPENVDEKRFASIYSSAIEALSKVNSYERK